MPEWLRVPEAKQHQGGREGGNETENEELQKVCKMQLQGTVAGFFFPSLHFGSV